MDEEYFRGVICYFLNFILEAVAWPIISHFYFVLYAFEWSKPDPGIFYGVWNPWYLTPEYIFLFFLCGL